MAHDDRANGHVVRRCLNNCLETAGRAGERYFLRSRRFVADALAHYWLKWMLLL
jgi:hypothetical protein